MKKKYAVQINEKILIAILIVLSIFLQSYNMNDLSGGDDSAWAETTHFVIENPKNMLYPKIPDQPIERSNKMYIRPAGIIPLAVTTTLFGRNNFSLMLPTLFFSSMTIIFLYLLLKRHFSPKIALISCVLFVSNPLYIGFTRIATFESQLIFTLVAGLYFFQKGIDEKKQKCFYISGTFFLLNFLTTEIRGLVPLIAIIPYLYVLKKNKKIDKKLLKKIIKPVMVIISIYIMYLTLPIILFNNTEPINEILGAFIHGTGQRSTSVNYLPIMESIKTIGSFLFFSPFAMLLFIPTIFGIIYTIKQRKPEHIYWTMFFISSIFFYLQGQPYPQRQTLYVLSFATLSVIALYQITNDLKQKKNLMPSIFAASFVIHIYLITIIFPKRFQPEYQMFLNLTKSFGLYNITNTILNNLILIIPLIIIVLIIIFIKIKNKKIINHIFLAINIILIVGLVISGIGIYKRESAISDVAKYLNENPTETEYLCVSGVHGNSLIYYTGKTCLFWPEVDIEWLNNNKEKIGYLIINKYMDYKTVGFGDIDEIRDDLNKNIHTEKMSKWVGNYPDKYNWLLKNSVRINNTNIDQTKFEIYKVI